jgi:hypothetical protein
MLIYFFYYVTTLQFSTCFDVSHTIFKENLSIPYSKYPFNFTFLNEDSAIRIVLFNADSNVELILCMLVS